jgi:lipoprotein
MNRKLVNGLLLLSVATVGCGTFTSCKDTDEDFKNEIILSQDELAKKLIAYIDEHKCECPKDAQALLDQVRAFLTNGEGQPLKSMSSAVLSLIDGTLEQTFGSDYTSWKGNVVMKGDLETKLEDYVKKGEIEVDLSGYVKDDDTYKQLGKDIATLNLWKSQMDEWKEGINKEDIEAALARANEAYMSALEANNILTDLVPLLEENLSDITETIGQISELVNTLEASLTSLQLEVKKLQPQIDAINQRLNKLITGIITQQTYNPMFGSINLPIGLQSNILANYYGYTDKDIVFPFGENATEYNGDKSVINNAAVQAAIHSLGYATKTVSGYYMSDDNDSNLGKLYLTINPNNVNFDGVILSLVDSQDNEALKIKAEKDDETILNFGWTRANNGFYAAKANIDPKDATKLNLRVEDGLKSAMKDALLDHTKSDFVALGKVILNQMENICPAYGVKASWTADEIVDGETVTKEYAVYSNYNIAAATIRPLGYEFLYGEGTNKELPTFGRLKDKLHEFFNDVKNDITFSFGLGINPDDYKINLDLSQIKFNVGIDKLTVIIPSMPIYEPGHENDDNYIVGRTAETPIELTYNADGTVSGNDGALNGLVDAINTAVKGMLTGNENSIQSIINKEVVTKMNSLISDLNDQLKGIDGNVESQIKDILDKIENQLAGKLDGVQGLVDKYNALAKKINNFLKNPNNYLQVMMAYETKNEGLHQLSNSINDPSLFNQAGGNSIELFATSYTAELVAPSYLKFVAVTRAWNGKNQDAAEVKRVNDANELLNVVRPGRQQRFGISGLKSGYKYEIVYTSLDYRGYTSTNLYYLTVK